MSAAYDPGECLVPREPRMCKCKRGWAARVSREDRRYLCIDCLREQLPYVAETPFGFAKRCHFCAGELAQTPRAGRSPKKFCSRECSKNEARKRGGA